MKNILSAVMLFTCLTGCSNAGDSKMNQSLASPIPDNTVIPFIENVAVVPSNKPIPSLPASQMPMPGSTQETLGTEMNFAQIQAGDYSSLLGTWTEIAFAGNGLGGVVGEQWHAGSPPYAIDNLSVTNEKIVFNYLEVVIQGNILIDSAGSHPLSFEVNDGYLSAIITDTADVAINWTVSFYPKGVVNDLVPNNDVKINDTKDLIVIWTSNNSYTEVFSRIDSTS